MRIFSKVLIANRGEIACRIIRGCRDAGIRTVAVFSEADRDGLHVRLADEARAIGPAPSSQSYLRIERILEAAKETGADAIHPGYGFLSENPDFSRACRSAGIAFVGPPPEAVALMGNKAAARALAIEAGVPVVPGTEPIESRDVLLEEGARIGYPVLVKATAGGGGKGMRFVESAKELPAAFEQARSEAMASFGDPSVYVEKFLSQPRHIEFQIVADTHGGIVHLYERECSIQRRHQKLIEEAPSPFLDEELRLRMGAAAVSLCRRAGYQNAGTVEFLVDRSRNFYFLEVNARLQVEHPVTELLTGIDLVRLQLEIASGGKLPFDQDAIARRGWAMELRITAEDPFLNFTPSAGELLVYRPPEGPAVRHDGGFFQGQVVTPHYDPLIAKLIVAGDDRAHCIARARRAIREYRIEGIRTTLPFFERMLEDERFLRGEMDVGFVERHWMSEMARSPAGSVASESARKIFLAALAAAASESEDWGTERREAQTPSRWKAAARSEQTGGGW
jgi:acetyl-CoA carboxylase biotin carboxylase subunit